MQLRLTLTSEQPIVLPINYQHMVQSAVYHRLSAFGNSNLWHNVGFGQKGFKGFVFGKLEGSYTVVDKQICFLNGLSLEIRSPVTGFCEALKYAFETLPEIRLGRNEYKITDIKLSNYRVEKDECVFFTASPAVAHKTDNETRKTIYYSPDDPEFAELLNRNYQNKYNAVTGNIPPDISIRIISKKGKTVTKYKDTWITAYNVCLSIKGAAEALDFIYNAGIGSKNSQGFGMLCFKE